MPIPLYARANLDPTRLDALARLTTQHTSLEKLMASGLAILEIIAADEFSLDALVHHNDLYLAYHMT